MPQTIFNNNNSQPMQNILNLFKDLILAYNLSPELSELEKETLKKYMLEIDGVSQELVDALMKLGI